MTTEMMSLWCGFSGEGINKREYKRKTRGAFGKGDAWVGGSASSVGWSVLVVANRQLDVYADELWVCLRCE